MLQQLIDLIKVFKNYLPSVFTAHVNIFGDILHCSNTSTKLKFLFQLTLTLSYLLKQWS